MTRLHPFRAVAAATIALAASTPVAAAVVFSGSMMSSGPPASSSGRCAPAASTVSISPLLGPDKGASNLGAFTFTDSHCINLPVPASYNSGQFDFDFGHGSTLIGTYDGALTASGTPGLLTNNQAFTITGGTGRYAGASGSFAAVGTVDFRAPPPLARSSFTGTLSAPGVAEPASWGLLLMGFGAVGAATRGRSRLQTVFA